MQINHHTEFYQKVFASFKNLRIIINYEKNFVENTQSGQQPDCL